MEQLQVPAVQEPAIISEPSTPAFIEANTVASSLEQIRNEHIIPVFIKDNEPVISHAEFIERTIDVVNHVYPGEAVNLPSVRLSHPIKGRIPEAKHKAAAELQDWEKTLYYERMAFLLEIPTINDLVGDNIVSLTVGGVKAYNLDNLYNRKGADEHFKIFIGFKVSVCTNLCVWTDGFCSGLKVKSGRELERAIYNLITSYDAIAQLRALYDLTEYSITEWEFAHLVGKCRMYRFLPTDMRAVVPELSLGDSQLGTVVRDYYKDESFCRTTDGSINLWRLFNLFTNATKSTYIDQYLERNVNAFSFMDTIRLAIRDKAPNWYLNR